MTTHSESLPLPVRTPADASDEPDVPRLDRYPIDVETPVGAILICPGGGYSMRAAHEGEAIARAFNDAGWHAFVLQYRVKPARFPLSLEDAVRAIRLIRSQAEPWRLRPDRIAVCGFSAGGHLAASLGTLHADPAVADIGDTALSARPDAMILGYPVILAGDNGHRGSFDRLLGREATEAQRRTLSLEQRVSADTPPTFLWHTSEDGGVPVQNSLLFGASLRDHRVPFELHVYPHGRHGLGLVDNEQDPVIARAAQWFPNAVAWLRSLGW